MKFDTKIFSIVTIQPLQYCSHNTLEGITYLSGSGEKSCSKEAG